MKFYSKKYLSMLLALSIGLSATACTSVDDKSVDSDNKMTVEETESKEQKEEKEEVKEETQGGKVEFTDMGENEVELEKPAERILNEWPSSATMMVCLGAGDKLIGVHKYVKTLKFNELIYPDLKDVPAVDENVEEMITYNPDVVIVTNNEKVESYGSAGLKTINLMFNNYDSMKKSLELSGKMIGGDYQKKAEKLSNYIDKNIKLVSDKLKDVKDEDKPLVYYAIGDKYKTTGKGTIMEEWTNFAGGKYASSDFGGGMQVEVNSEDIIQKNPDVIFVSGGAGGRELLESFKVDPVWAEVDAVKNNNIHIIPQGCFAWDRFGAESAMQILWAATKIHPDKVDIDMKEEARKFYKEYSDYDIPEDVLDQVMGGGIE